MSKKEIYREHCKTEKKIPIFSQPWWLDATCSDSWDVSIVEKNDEVLASMPYLLKKKFGITVITQPALTQNLGPWFAQSKLKNSKLLAEQKDQMESLIAQLPSYDYFLQNWHYSQTNWLPFYWKGFEQTTRYTYVVDKTNDMENVIANFERSKKKNIRKSEKIVKITYDISAQDFYDNHKMTLMKQGAKISYDFAYFKKIYDSSYEQNQGRTIAAYDEEGNLHAALFVVWDQMSAYDLISTIDPDYRVHGAASLLIKEMISYTSEFVNVFDFEGSMIESVERSFRQFGAVQRTYFNISHKKNFLIRLYIILNSFFKK